MTTKTKSAAISTLEAKLAEVQAELAALTQKAIPVSATAAQRLTEGHWHAIRFALVVGGAEKPELAKGRKGYALVKGADVKLYMACKGFENTLKAQRNNGQPVGLHTEVNDKGRSQVMYAQETLAALVKAGFVAEDAKILQDEPKARSKKQS